MDRIVIDGATLIPCDDDGQVLENAVVGVEGDRITFVRDGEPHWEGARHIDGSGCILIPGLINAHTHVAMTVMRGSADDLSLMDWLSDKVWPMEMAMSDEDRYWASKLAMLEMLKSGITCFLDMSLGTEGVAKACLETGLRARICEALLETQDPDRKRLDAAVEQLASWKARAHPLVDFDLGPHALYTCTRPYMDRMMEAARDLDARIQIHVAETTVELDECRRKYGMTPVEVLEEWGVLHQPTTAAHCIHLNERDREIFAKCGVTAVHNPSSNMKLAAGIMGAEALLAAGVTVALGTDSSASNNNLSILGEMRRASLLQKAGDGDATSFGAGKALFAATRGGAAAVGRSDELGQIREGYLADLTLIRADGLHSWPPADPISHLTYALRADDVDTVIVGGRVLLHRGEFTEIDSQEVMARCREIATHIRV
ncbi:amidohydrolase [bacterium]|nr:amidohydrolase [bacterium]